MSVTAKSNGVNYLLLALIVLPSVFFTVFLALTSENDITPPQFFCALILLMLPIHAYYKWREEGRGGLPLLAMITIIYWLYYAFPLFWGDRDVLQADNNNRIVSSEAVTWSMVMVLLGVFSLLLGLRAGLGRKMVPRKLPYIQINQGRLNYIRCVLGFGALLSIFGVSPYALGEGGRQIILTAVGIIPAIAFAILFRAYLRGEATRFDKLLVAFYLLIRFMTAISSGWLGMFVGVIIICAAIYLAERKKIPALIVTVAIVAILFFQVGKEEFRKTYWVSQTNAGNIEKIDFWINASVSKWGEALSDPSGQAIRSVTYPSVSRVALLTQTANVMEMTPMVVPYQYGRLYTYIFISWIPRYFWPDKPSVSEANQFYQVAYGLTTEEQLNTVGIAVGILAESFISFGWIGVVAIMFLLGVFFDFYQHTFLSQAAGILMNGIGFVLLPQFLSIESQLAVYLSGILQTLVLTFLVMLPIITFKRQASQARQPQPVLMLR
ncbi:MAG TPA: hypothetical protein VGO91_19130 [Pyrinomonadaceae bacterium]|jgi:hypothetical protein|nr:hypothetical protein [Pyrinomonadaceae bacterium]